MTTGLLKQAAKLPVPDRIKLVEDIWDSIADDSDAFLLTSAQKGELDRRLELIKKKPGRGIPWEDAKKQILKRHAREK
jgi:putative addiction module component (TIGR02574 family)